jgi:hypothetical protein
MSDRVTRDSIFATAKEMPFACVMVPEWGGGVRVYSMTASQRDEFDRETTRRKKKKLALCVRERLLIAAVRGDDGQPLFAADDEQRLAELPVGVAEKVFISAAKMNGFIVEEDDDGGN